MGIFTGNDDFDRTTAADVEGFSKELIALLSKYPNMSANTLYVIFSFHATDMMRQITEQAANRVKLREEHERQQKALGILQGKEPQ